MAGRFFARQKQKFLGKHKTIDEDFEIQRGSFKELKDSLKAMEKQARSLEKHMKELVAVTQSLCEHTAELYDGSKPVVAENAQAASNEITGATLACTDALHQFDVFLKGKMEEINSIEKRISARDDALLWHDAKRDAVQSLIDKPPKDGSKLTEAQLKTIMPKRMMASKANCTISAETNPPT
eukprot:TRINITY_DN9141_c0_g1_i1.p1 TRINITY_DN9141_c0_g1~~TRINITY_DN9141_c0_g1_i1.p1  ORF type:complete len:195 (-),score=28.39 TRINITY_DN9141_c0_g1_i1:132-677(-)